MDMPTSLFFRSPQFYAGMVSEGKILDEKKVKSTIKLFDGFCPVQVSILDGLRDMIRID